MRAFRVLAIACLSFYFLSAQAGQICMSDGSCINDPSLTTETVPKVDLPSGLNLESTGTWSMIQTKCNKDNYNKGVVKYSSPEACLRENMAEVSKRAQDTVAKAKKESGNADGGGGGQGQGGQGGQGQQGGGDQQGQGDQANNGNGDQQQPQGDSQQGDQGGAQAAQNEPVKGEEPLKMPPGTSCPQAVAAHLQRCEKTRKAADLKCDPSKDKGIQDSEASSKDTGMLSKASDRTNRNASMSALDQHQLSKSVEAFAGSCRLGHRQCERECLTVRKAFEKYCASAAPAEKAKAQADVAKAEGKENGLYCSKDLAQKADQADQQAAVSSQNAEQHASVNDQTSGSGGSGGGGGADGLSGLLGQMGQLNQQKKAEKEALKKALEAAAAQEGMEQACQRAQFQDLEACVCRGLSASSCASKMPTRLPSSFDPNYLLTTPAE